MGERKRAKLTAAQVVEIRARFQSGHARRRRAGKNTATELAREFGIGVSCVSSIVNRRTWRHVKATAA